MSTVWNRAGHMFDPAAILPLPADAYTNAEVFADEMQRLFSPSSGLVYVGHDVLLPTTGHQRADADPRLLLTRDDEGCVRALANVCSHAFRPLVCDDVAVQRSCITCPFHEWSYRRDGSFIGGRDVSFADGAPGDATRRDLAIENYELLSWHGFHFTVDDDRVDEYRNDLARIDADFAARGIADWLDLDGWVVLASENETYRGDWKMFLEVFGDCYHVPPYHPGLASFADCETIEWTFGDNFHVQFLELSEQRGRRSPLYEAWADGLDRYYELRGEQKSPMAVAWAGVYPNLMFEAYNGLRVISIAIPTGPDSYVNRMHYCVPADMEQLVPGLPQIIKDAFDETGIEDRILMEARFDGMHTAASLGLDAARYHVNLTGSAPEAGVAHFFDWWTRRMTRRREPSLTP
ncbi:MAG: hypothetical protein RLZZ623_1966 [Actinomycetota bacterium]